jgi:hypothetical protein
VHGRVPSGCTAGVELCAVEGIEGVVLESLKRDECTTDACMQLAGVPTNGLAGEHGEDGRRAGWVKCRWAAGWCRSKVDVHCNCSHSFTFITILSQVSPPFGHFGHSATCCLGECSPVRFPLVDTSKYGS